MTACNSNALSLLSAYNSESDGENDSVPGPKVSVKRCHKDDRNASKFFKTKSSSKLPLPQLLIPDDIKTNLSEEIDSVYNGRIRTFPHERGNWSTYVYIPYEPNPIFEELINKLITQCRSSIVMQQSNDLHISLTKTLILRHHWIDSFIKTLTNNLSHIGWFVMFFDNIKIYCNEERTRTFLGLCIKSGHDTLVNIVNALDQGLSEFNLPQFYKDPSFHMSLAWCVGDQEDILKLFIDNFNDILSQFMGIHPQCYWYIHVKQLLCKTGNKMYSLNLAQTSK